MKKMKINPVVTLSVGIASAVCGLFFGQKFFLNQAEKHADLSELKTYTHKEGDCVYQTIGSGKPLLLLHSMLLGSSHKEWSFVAEELSKKYQVFIPDLPAFGDSFKPQSPWTAYQYAQWITDFSKSVIKKPCFLVGANGSADLAFLTATLHPEIAAEIVLISPEGLQHSFATNDEVKPRLAYQSPMVGTQIFLAETSVASIKRRLQAGFFAKEKVPTDLAKEFSSSARRGAHAQTTFAALKTGFWRSNTKHALQTSTLEIPLSIFWGEENTQNPIANFDLAQELQPNATYILFEECGEFPHIESSFAFQKIIKECLN